MKKLTITLLTTVFFSCFFVKAQFATNDGTLGTTAPTTTPANVSQFEALGAAITQNSWLSSITPPAGRETGNFSNRARWNTMGNIPATTQTLNGFRTQTDGRGLAWGHSVPNGGTVSNGFIEWIGNSAILPVVAPGNLEFRFALNSTGAAASRIPIFTMAPITISSSSVVTPSFNYAAKDAFVGQLQSGAFGSFGTGDTWAATGQITLPSNLISYGTRHQYEGYTVNTGLLRDNNAGTINALMEFGNDINAQGFNFFKFRAFTSPTSPTSAKNVWQSSNKFNDVVLGIQDYGVVNPTGNFMLSVFDGVASAASSTALSFVQKAGIYATGDGLDQNNSNAQLSSYAAVVGDISRVNVSSSPSQKYAILGIADGNYSGGSSSAIWAGYFIGNVGCTGTVVSISDQKFKKDINAEENIMPKLMELQPKNYFFDVNKNKSMALSNKLQHGLISQEVEKVFPELVVDAFAPNTSSDKKEDGKPIAYKGLNYMGLISMLLKGIQEQQVQIDELKSKLETATINTLVVTDKNSLPAEIQNKAFTLSQNVPNPFSDNTTISYTIPATAGKAILAVFDLNGKMLLQYNLQQGKNTIVVKGNTLTAGMYLYSLIADGQEVLSKRMVLTR